MSCSVCGLVSARQQQTLKVIGHLRDRHVTAKQNLNMRILFRPAGESCGGAQRIGIHQFAVHHDYPRLAQIGESRRRIAFDERKVGGLTDFD